MILPCPVQVCYRKGYNRLGSRRHTGDMEGGKALSFLERADEDTGRGIFGRSVREVTLGLGRGEGKRKSRRQRDYACPEYLVFVGSRGSLLQVGNSLHLFSPPYAFIAIFEQSSVNEVLGRSYCFTCMLLRLSTVHIRRPASTTPHLSPLHLYKRRPCIEWTACRPETERLPTWGAPTTQLICKDSHCKGGSIPQPLLRN